jgi:hypothetical protein
MDITLTLGGIKFPVKVENTEQEELFRKTEKELQTVIEKYKSAYVGRSNDFVYLFVAFHCMRNKIEAEQRHQKEGDKILQRLQQLTNKLS